MIVALASNFGLAWDSAIYLALFGLQLGFYLTAVTGTLRSGSATSVLLKLPSYFFIVNLAIALAWWRYLRGERVIMWEPSKR